MSRHTAGPWHVSPLDGRTCGPSRLLVCSGTEIRQMQAVAVVTLRTGETSANARLIAAAPDLLRALKALLAHSDSWRVIETADGDIARARAALAKAEGVSAEESA